MKALADPVIPGEALADIGTDHAFVPIRLLESGVCPFAVLVDINEGPVVKAKSHLDECGISADKYDLRQGDGLRPVKPFEVSSVIIAGMGGENIIDILDYDLQKTKSFKRFILQPRKRAWLLRKYLLKSGFKITEEKLVRESEKICEITVAEPCCENQPLPSDINLLFLPPMMRKDPLFSEFLDEYIRKLKVVLDNMANAQTAEDIAASWEDRYNYALDLRKGLKK